MQLFLDLDINRLVDGVGSHGDMDAVSDMRSSNGVVAVKVIQGGQMISAAISGFLLKFVAKDVGEYDNQPRIQTTAFTWNADRSQYEAPYSAISPALDALFGAQGTPIDLLSGDETTDLITTDGDHELEVGNKVHFLDLVGGAGLNSGEEYSYFIISTGLTNDDLKVAETINGAAVDFTTAITGGQIVRDEDDVSEISLMSSLAWKADSGDPWRPAGNKLTFTLANNVIRDDDGAPVDPTASVQEQWLRDRAIRHDEVTSPALSQNSRSNALENSQLAITALTGGAAGALDSIPTASGAISTGRWVAVIVSGEFSVWQLQAGTTAEDYANGIVRPDDYDGSTNARIWIKLL